MLELARDRPALFSVDEFDRFNRQIHRYAALVDDAEEYAEHCQFLLDELPAQVEEETDKTDGSDAHAGLLGSRGRG